MPTKEMENKIEKFTKMLINYTYNLKSKEFGIWLRLFKNKLDKRKKNFPNEAKRSQCEPSKKEMKEQERMGVDLSIFGSEILTPENEGLKEKLIFQRM